jgi:uncharacterized protein YigA (DUF484 family)
MSTQKTEKNGEQAIAAETVEHYLRAHPEFFLDRDALLLEITVPHQINGAVSLVERQVALLREQNRRYRRQLQELVEIARSNDELLGRLQQLTLRMMDAPGPEPVFAALEDSLRADFNADAASLYLFGSAEPALPAAPGGFLRVSVQEAAHMGDELRRLLAGDKPVCGRLRSERLAELFGDDAAIGSVALLPLIAGAENRRLLGALAIGSHDSDRFNAEMATTYLCHLADLIAHRLAPFVPAQAPARPA